MEELISEDSNDNDGDKIVFLDWDDTLFPSTELLNNNIDLYNCNIDNIMINIHDPFDFLNFDFFDDDICTSKENKENREKQKNDESKQMRDDIKECEKKVIKLLELFICKKYRVYIITNATNGWVENCIANIYREIHNNLITDDIIIISARSYYEKYVDDIRDVEGKNFATKYLCVKNQLDFIYDLEHANNDDDQCTINNNMLSSMQNLDIYDFLTLKLEKIYKKEFKREKMYNRKIKQIISIGDQKTDILMANKIAKWNINVSTKTIKLLNRPNCKDLIRQLHGIVVNFDNIFSDDESKSYDMNYIGF